MANLAIFLLPLLQWGFARAYPGLTEEDCGIFENAMKQLLEKTLTNNEVASNAIESVMRQYEITRQFSTMTAKEAQTAIKSEQRGQRQKKKQGHEDVVPSDECIHHLEIVQTILRRFTRGETVNGVYGSLARSPTFGKYVCPYIEEADNIAPHHKDNCAGMRHTLGAIKTTKQKMANTVGETSKTFKELPAKLKNLFKKKDESAGTVESQEQGGDQWTY